MVRTAERPFPNQPGSGTHKTCDGVNGGGFQSFLIGQRRKNAGQTLGKHTFSGAGRANHQQVVPACGGNFHGAACLGLTANIAEIRPQPLSGGIVAGALSGAEHLLPEQVIDDIQRTAGKVDRQTLSYSGLGGILCGNK